MFPAYPCNQIKKIHQQLYSIQYYVKAQRLASKIHPKWNFGFLKLKFGMLDWEWVRIE